MTQVSTSNKFFIKPHEFINNYTGGKGGGNYRVNNGVHDSSYLIHIIHGNPLYKYDVFNRNVMKFFTTNFYNLNKASKSFNRIFAYECYTCPREEKLKYRFENFNMRDQIIDLIRENNFVEVGEPTDVIYDLIVDFYSSLLLGEATESFEGYRFVTISRLAMSQGDNSVLCEVTM